MNPTPFQTRREKLAECLGPGESLVLFAGRPPHRSADADYPFDVNRHFYYLTGLSAPQLILLVTRTKDKTVSTLFLERPDPAAERWTGARLRAEAATRISAVERTATIDEFPVSLHNQLASRPDGNLWLDLFHPGPGAAPTPALALAAQLRQEWPGLQIRDLSPILSRLRAVKDETEVRAIEAAGKLTLAGLAALCAELAPDVRECRLEGALRHRLLADGNRDHAFPPIIAGGKNATTLHYEENLDPVPAGQLVLVDCGARHGLYCADVSRTYPVDGRFTPRQRELYEIVLQALRETTAAVKPGISTHELNEITKRVLAAGAIRAGLIQDASELATFYYHGVSHHLGLDAHDPAPGRHEPLQAGNVITVEPGLYVAAEEIGIRLEDDVLVTDSGHRVLTPDIPLNPDDVEEFIARSRQKRGISC